MIEWLFISVWHSLVGLVLLLTVVIGSVVILAQAIAKSNEHDQARCQCAMCKQRRATAASKRFGEPQKPVAKPMYADRHFISTDQLYMGRIVSAKGVTYRVMRIENIDFGVKVHLRNTITGRPTSVDIMTPHMDRKIWRVQ